MITSLNSSYNEEMFHTKVAERIKTQFTFNYFLPENRTVNGIWKKCVGDRHRPQMTI